MEDVDEHASKLDSALNARREAYQTELARQQLMEEKRKEFASLAEGFVDWIEAQRQQLQQLTGVYKSLCCR